MWQVMKRQKEFTVKAKALHLSLAAAPNVQLRVQASVFKAVQYSSVYPSNSQDMVPWSRKENMEAALL